MPQPLRAPRPVLALAPLLALALMAVAAPATSSDVPFVPTPEATVQKMLEVVEAGPDDIVYDLGSGDGRIVIAAVRDFDVKRAIGIDINAELVEESRKNAEEAGVADRASFTVGNIFEENFSDATVITMYLLNSVNLRLRPRLLDELRPGTRLVSHQFHMADWEADLETTGGGRRIYHWIVPAKVDGTWRWQADGEEFRLDLQQEFQKVSGTLAAYGREVPIEDATLSGDALTFAARTTNGDRAVHLRFSGRVDDGAIVAEMATGGTPAAVRAERVQ
jgi:SAM-dependent methyltransferase